MKLAAPISLFALVSLAFAAIPTFAAPETAPAIVEAQPRGGLPNFGAKLKAGGDVRVAYLGGSITEANGWRPLTTAWLGKQFPTAKIVEINAAIPGTGSDLGVSRLERDVLSQKPDLLFVEFAVNDQGYDPPQVERAVEGIVRQTWAKNALTDICFVYTLSQPQLADLQAGKMSRPAQAMERVAAHYGVPSIHLGTEVARMISEGKMTFTGAPGGAIPAFSGDGTHPHRDPGHLMYLAALQRNLPTFETTGAAAPHPLPAPLRKDNWENARVAALGQITRTAGWQKLDAAANPLLPAHAKFLSEVWRATSAGEALTFRFNGQSFGFGGVKGPDSGTFTVTVDDKEPIKTTFFDSFSREDRFRIKPWFYPTYLSAGQHSVRIELLAETPPKAEILQKAGVAMTDAAKFAGNNLYIGEIYVVGELLPTN